MEQLSYRRHRFPPPIIQHAIWLYLRFTLSYRDVEEPLAARGLDISIAAIKAITGSQEIAAISNSIRRSLRAQQRVDVASWRNSLLRNTGEIADSKFSHRVIFHR
jgi:transposase-like protein